MGLLHAKVEKKKLQLYSRNKHNYNVIRKNFFSPCPHPCAEGKAIEVGL